jgi:hypothetical protein
MHTLPDPRHETFASLRASGHDVASAYVHAGYSVKNIKQRSRKLLHNPSIQARINHLKACLPRIAELHDHHCPSLLLMPETRHEMLVWLWQVMNGTREVRPAQMRAATLYCRMRGWHLGKGLPAAESSTPADITPAEQALLAMASRENIAHERTGTPRPPESLTRFQTLMADHALPSLRQDSLGRPIPTPAPHSHPTPEVTLTPLTSLPSPLKSSIQNPPPVNPANSAILSKIPLPESESAPHKSLSQNPPPINPAILSKKVRPTPRPSQSPRPGGRSYTHSPAGAATPAPVVISPITPRCGPSTRRSCPSVRGRTWPRSSWAGR